MIYFRVDGNEEIGTGHIMRCLSIASALKSSGKAVTFITSDEVMSPVLTKNNIHHIILETNWNDMDGELPKLLELLKRHKIKQIILDSYQVTNTYLKVLASNVNIVYIDDLGKGSRFFHMLINYNIYAQRECYTHLEQSQMLLGPHYAPLRPEFYGLGKFLVNPQISKVLLLSGGTDPYNVLGYFARTILPLGMELHLVIGAFNENLKDLSTLAKGNPQVFLHQNVTTMSLLMQSCDIAISAGGTTTYELCAVGIPMLLYSMADNQLQIVKAFEEKGIAPYLGDIRNEKNILAKNLIKALEQGKCPVYRKNQSEKMQVLVDGNGAPRLAERVASG